MHDWSGDFKYFGDVGRAAQFIGDYCRKYGRIGVTQTKEKYGCYDDQTEVLTNNGWKLFKNIDINRDLFATLDKDNYLIYQQAIKYHEQSDHKKLYSIKSRGVDLKVTLDHKLYIAKGSTYGGQSNCHGKSYPYELQTYQELFFKPKKFLKSFRWKGTDPKYFNLPRYQNEWNNIENSTRIFYAEELKLSIIPWLRFLGWFVAEGYVSKESQIVLCLNGTIEEEKHCVENILKELPFEYKTTKRDSAYIITIYSKQLGIWLLNNCGHLAENKKVPEFIHGLASRLIEEFLINLYLGDGWKTKTTNIISTVSARLEQDVSLLLMKAGYSFRTSTRTRSQNPTMINNRIIKHNYPEITVNWLKKSNEFELYNSHDLQKNKESIVDYDGKVYCVSIPNQLLLIRRKGKPVWCGNTARVYCGFGWYQLHSITHPGYVYSRYPKWLWCFDIDYLSKIVRIFNPLTVRYQMWIYRRAYELAFKKWPLIKEEIIDGADYPEIISEYFAAIPGCDKHREEIQSNRISYDGKNCAICKVEKDQ